MAEAEPVDEPESEPADEPEPVRVAMASAAPLPGPAAEPSSSGQTLVAQDEVEEVEESDVPEAPEEDDVPVAPEDSGFEDVPPPPPDTAPYEEVPPPPPPPPAAEETPVEDSPADEIPAPPEDSGAVEVPPPADEVPPPPSSDYEEAIEEVPTSPGYSEVEERVEISGALKDMTWVGFQQTMEASRVFIKTNAPVRYHVSEEGNNLVVLELENTRIPLRNNSRFLDTHFFATAVTMITPREIEGVSRNVRIEIQLRDKVPYSAGQDENMVYLDFQRP
jgi:hypothetical protein